jgi:hypothetical protein
MDRRDAQIGEAKQKIDRYGCFSHAGRGRGVGIFSTFAGEPTGSEG